MLLQIKVYMILVLYFFGALFMIVCPPRNFEMSGSLLRSPSRTGQALKYSEYMSYDEIIQAIDLYNKTDPGFVVIVDLTKNTTEHRSIKAMELFSDRDKKPGILIIGALDGMAWGVPNALLELANLLLYHDNYRTPLFNEYDWYIVPLSNPDGFVFTQSIRTRPPIDADVWSHNVTARNGTRPSDWHKNMDAKTEQDPCFGTRINRNFAYHWQDDHSETPDRCSQLYPGPKPFSSPEAQALREYIDKIRDNIQLAIHMHASFEPKKELILYPWRFTQRQPSNLEKLQAIGEFAARKSRMPDGRVYEVHQSSHDRRVAGSLSDYLTGVAGIDLTYTAKPYHVKFPHFNDTEFLKSFIKKTTSVVFNLVSGWRSTMQKNTLVFFGKEIHY